jgi:polygalacturonase
VNLTLPRRRFLLSVTLLGLWAAAARARAAATGGKRHVISDYGAVADGTTLNTVAIQKAIDTASAAGGGTVVIPPGTFLSGSIFLKAGVGLHLEEGAVLFGSNNIEDYPKRETRIEGHFEPWRMALVNAQELEGVRITGKGVLDGNGVTYWQAFWKRRQENPRCTNLEVERPRIVFIDRCRDVRVEGVRLQDSGFWNLHLYRCRNVTIEGISITIPSSHKLGIRGPSTDGIDVDSSQDVTIRKCYISTHDDNIALKGSKGPLADKDTDSPPVENILVEDVECGEGNGLITCGSEATLIRNVSVRNCKMSGGATLLTLKLRPDTPQHYENITMENITLAGTGRLINCAPWTQFFDLKGEKPPTRQVNKITLRNIKGEYGAFGILRGNAAKADTGTPADILRNITLENIDVKLARPALTLGPTENLVVKNVTVNGQPYELPAVTP